MSISLVLSITSLILSSMSSARSEMSRDNNTDTNVSLSPSANSTQTLSVDGSQSSSILSRSGVKVAKVQVKKAKTKKKQVAKHAVVSIASYNVLCKNCSPSRHSWESRRIAVAQRIVKYSPDIIGLQEASEQTVASGVSQYQDLVNVLNNKFDKSYAVAVPSSSHDNTRGTRIIYDSSKLTLVKYGSTRYPHLSGQKARFYIWGIFKVNANGQEFYMGNTHTSPRGEGLSSHGKQAQVMLATYKKTAPTNMPSVITGDMNEARTYPTGRPIVEALDKAGFTQLLNMHGRKGYLKSGGAKNIVNGNYNSFNGLSQHIKKSKQGRGGANIDYIFSRNATSNLRWVTTTNQIKNGHYVGTFPSDHNMVFGTVKL